MKCDIIIPIWNNLEFTKACLEHTVKNTRYSYKLILVDNDSDTETKNYLEDFSGSKMAEVELLRNDENVGFVKAINKGLKVSSSPYVCMFNNDTLPAKGWLEAMVQFAEQHRDVGLINPQCDGHGSSDINDYADKLALHAGEYMEMSQCQGFCMLVKREVIDKIGYLDETFGIGGYDDTDYSMRAHKVGYKSVSIKNSYVYHRLHASFDKSGDREEWVKRNKQIYYKKWGKHLRVGIPVYIDGPSDKVISNIVMLAYGLAREWTWVHLWIDFRGDAALIKEWINKSIAANGLPPHQNIRIDYFHLPKPVFNLTIAGKLLERCRKRMQDKRFDAILTGEGISIPFAGIVGSSTIKLNLREGGADWQEKGKKMAISIKEKRDGKISV